MLCRQVKCNCSWEPQFSQVATKRKKGKREQLKAKKCEKRENGVRGVVEKRRAGTAGKRTIDIYTRRLERKRRRKSPHKTKQEIHLYTRTRKGNSRCWALHFDISFQNTDSSESAPATHSHSPLSLPSSRSLTPIMLSHSPTRILRFFFIFSFYSLSKWECKQMPNGGRVKQKWNGFVIYALTRFLRGMWNTQLGIEKGRGESSYTGAGTKTNKAAGTTIAFVLLGN